MLLIVVTGKNALLLDRLEADHSLNQEREKAAVEQDQREKDIALGNPLLMPTRDSDTKRRWDDDVVFRNQARGTEKKGKPEFVNVGVPS